MESRIAYNVGSESEAYGGFENSVNLDRLNQNEFGAINGDDDQKAKEI